MDHSLLSTNNFYTLGITVFLLGIRHGFDADHLAAIDGLTRFNAGHRASLSRNAGYLFSLGHGIVVISTAILVALVAKTWAVPSWVVSIGVWSSIAVLLALAIANLNAVLRVTCNQMVQPARWRGRLFMRCITADSFFSVIAVGALFAVSFDTLSLAAMFGMTASRFGSWLSALLAAAVFVLGMLVTDGLNGVWIAYLIRRSNRAALAMSRIMALAISGICLIVAAVGVANQLLPTSSSILEVQGCWISVAIILILAASFAIGLRMTAPAAVNDQSLTRAA